MFRYSGGAGVARGGPTRADQRRTSPVAGPEHCPKNRRRPPIPGADSSHRGTRNPLCRVCQVRALGSPSTALIKGRGQTRLPTLRLVPRSSRNVLRLVCRATANPQADRVNQQPQPKPRLGQIQSHFFLTSRQSPNPPPLFHLVSNPV